MIIKDTPSAVKIALPRERIGRLWKVLFAILAVVGLGASAIPARSAIQPLADWFKEMTAPRTPGFLDIDSVAESIIFAPNRFLYAQGHVEALPRLRLDVKFKHWQRIIAKRNEAMERGVLLTEADDEVPAVITDGISAHRAKIRLKGDMPDHFSGKAWSLRVISKGPFFGMRRFSLIHPRTRQYAVGPLFHEHLRREGILAPRHQFVKVTVNGTDWGIMLLEEHPGKELLEFQGRKAGVLGRLGGDTHMEHIAVNHAGKQFRTHQYGPYNTPWTAAYRAYGSKKLENDPHMANQLALAEALVAGYQEGRLPPGEVFDLNLFARYFVVSALWGDLHPLYFDNVRLYLNPYTLKLEPVAGDNVALRRINTVDLHSRVLLVGFLRDSTFRQVLDKAITDITDSVLNAGRMEELEADRRAIEATIHTSLPFLLELDLSIIRYNAGFIASYGAAFFPQTDGLYSERPQLTDTFMHHVLLRVYDRPDKQVVIANMLNQPITVRSVMARCVDQLSDQIEQDTWVELASDTSIGATALGRRTTRLEFDLPPATEPARCGVEVTTQRPGSSEIRTVKASRQIRYLTDHPLSPGGSLSRPLQSLRWLHWNEAKQRFDTEPGHWRVDRPTILPEGAGLRLEAGTTLSFAPDAYLLLRGPFDIAGTAERPVVLQPQDKDQTWSGIFVMSSPQPSHWRHAQVRRTNVLADGYLRLTGGVTFYRSEVSMQNVSFLGTMAEDALNIVQSHFILDHTMVRDTRSDGFDCDFCDGRIVESTFSTIGGDAVDVSGTRAELEALVIEDVRDKAISVGEGSDVVARDLRLRNVGTGIASKDNSITRLTDSEIDMVRVAGLMSYVKKPAYGPASIEARRVTFGPNVASPAIAQTRSTIVLDGRAILETDLDVESFYEEGAMRK
jgi:hypothetical protein